jgi:outer membrane protein assembly factor BamB
VTHRGTRCPIARLGRAARAVASIGAMLTLGGCILEDILGPKGSNPPTVWSSRLVDHDGISAFPPMPLLAGNAAVFGLSNSTIMARDLDTGRPLWSSTFDGRAIEGHRMHYAQGVVLAVSPSRAHGFDGATGRLLWTYDAPPSPWGASLLGGPGEQSYFGNSYTDADGETFYVPAWGGNISALDARTGARRWLWQFDPAISETGYPGDCATNADLAVSERYLYVPCQLWIMTLERFTGRIVAIRNVPKSEPRNVGVKGHVRNGLLTARGLAVALIANSRGSSSTWYAAAFREP